MALADDLTAQWLKDRYLVGITLTDDFGEEYPAVHYTHAIRSAIGTIERELELVLHDVVSVTGERSDVRDFEPGQFIPISLHKRPVRSVSAFGLKFGPSEVADIPASWIQLSDPDMGEVQLVPSAQGSAISTIGIIGLNWLYTYEYTPGLYSISYKAGFTGRVEGIALGTFSGRLTVDGPLTITPSRAPGAGETYTAVVSGTNLATGLADTETLTWTLIADGSNAKTTTKGWSQLANVALSTDAATTPTFELAGDNPVPDEILEAIGLKASIPLLDTAGDLIVGAGIASKSISMDGLSQSINTTSSATNAGYGARIISQHKNRYQDLMEALRNRWRLRRVFGA